MQVCPTAKCRQGVLTFVDHQAACGCDNTLVNLHSGRLECATCRALVGTAWSCPDTGMVEVAQHLYTRCAFCHAAVSFSKTASPQQCTRCRREHTEKAIETARVCVYCDVQVTLSRRGGAQTIRLDDGSSCHLCRQHRLPRAGSRTFGSVADVVEALVKS